MLVSVITPVYNTRPELILRAVKSVAGQGVACEMIIVDDGSTPDIAKYIDNLSREFDFLKIVHSPNEGVSSSRNTAIDLSVGEYIAFLDADDEMADGSLVSAIEILEDFGCEAVYGNSILVYPDGGCKNSFLSFSDVQSPLVFEGDQIEYLKMAQFHRDALKIFDLPDILIPNNWGALFRGDLIRRQRFDTDVVMAEDRLFNLKILSNAKRVALTDLIWYKYYQYGDTATHRVRPNALLEFETTARKYERMIPTSSPLMADALYSGIFECYLQALIFAIPRRCFRRNMRLSRCGYVKSALSCEVFQLGISNVRPKNTWQKLQVLLAKGACVRSIIVSILLRDIIRR